MYTQKRNENNWLADRWIGHVEKLTELEKGVFNKSESRRMKTSTEGTREKGIDRHEERVIKPGFRQAFMGSQTQTPFEAVKRFWAYNSDNSDWRKTEIWFKLCTQTLWDTRNQGNKITSKMDFWKKKKMKDEEKERCTTKSCTCSSCHNLNNVFWKSSVRASRCRLWLWHH